MRLFRIWFAVCAVACAQGIEIPAIGMIVDSSGALRQVQGVAGSFVLGPVSMSGVLSAACSKQLCLVKTDSTIVSATGETSAPPGPAIFGFSGDNAIVFFPEPRMFARWHDNVLEPLDWVVDSEVLSVRLDEVAVRNGVEASIVHSDGSVADSLPEARGPVLLLPNCVVFATKDEIVLRQDDGEVRFELSDARSITAMGPHYAEIHTGDAVYALRTESGREALYRLPGSAP
ncbi:MAG: hypothetical protein LAP61_24750 [Acidobacteriia bacterium]|nr:hypothetical protein [Terriglobia bacterium]